MIEQSALPFNHGYLPPSDPAFDFRSQIHALRDPVYRNRHDNSEKGAQLYQLFNDGNMEEFYEMYFRADTMPLAKFYFFYQILRNENTRIHDPYYKSIKDEIRRQLFETPPPLKYNPICIKCYRMRIMDENNLHHSSLLHFLSAGLTLVVERRLKEN